MKHAVIVCVLLGLSSCLMQRQYDNLPVEREKLAELEPGVTTAGEVVELMGGPNRVIELYRRSAYLYEFVQTKQAGLFLIVVNLRGQDLKSDRVWLFFDENDILSHYGASFEADLAEFKMPWES